jgi:hypothetical protein
MSRVALIYTFGAEKLHFMIQTIKLRTVCYNLIRGGLRWKAIYLTI